MKDAEKLYELELHEEVRISEDCIVMRVITGWIYKHYEQVYDHNGDLEGSRLRATTFVPFSSEKKV